MAANVFRYERQKDGTYNVIGNGKYLGRLRKNNMGKWVASYAYYVHPVHYDTRQEAAEYLLNC